jgi:Cu+-exporting ATPase
MDHSLETSKRTSSFWAFAYNAILITGAAGVLSPFFGILLNPIFAASSGI